MNFMRRFLPHVIAAVVVAGMLGVPSQARADFIIRVTDVNSGGTINATMTATGLSAPNGSGALIFNSAVGNFTITLVTNIATTGPGFTAASQTINITYNGGTGTSSQKLIIEVLGNMFSNPT